MTDHWSNPELEVDLSELRLRFVAPSVLAG